MPKVVQPFVPLEGATQILPAVTAVLMRDGAKIPEALKATLLERLAGGGVAPLIAGMEGLYAARDHLSSDSWTQLGQIAQAVAANGFGEEGRNGRATAILTVARRERGEAGTFPPKGDDPAVAAVFSPPVERED